MKRGGAQGASEIISRPTTIRNRRGLHARAAGKFVKLAGRFAAEISVIKGGQVVSGLSIMGLLMLAAGPNSEIVILAEGPEARQAVDALCVLVENKFEED